MIRATLRAWWATLRQRWARPELPPELRPGAFIMPPSSFLMPPPPAPLGPHTLVERVIDIAEREGIDLHVVAGMLSTWARAKHKPKRKPTKRITKGAARRTRKGKG